MCGSILLLSLNLGLAQIVNPGGGISWWTQVPGLTNEMGYTVTNIIDGGASDGPTGQVERIDQRNYRIKFPLSMDVLTNNVQGSVTIDPSGLTTVTYMPGFTFPSLPSVTFTMRDINANLVAEANIIELHEDYCTVEWISSGSVLTNEWRFDYRANYGLSYGVVGDMGTIAMLIDGTNIMRLDGTYPATGDWDMDGYGINHIGSLQINGGIAGSWLAGEAPGVAYWQSRTIANLNDGTDVFKKDGTVLPTANWDMNGKTIYDLGGFQRNGGSAGYVLQSDASGYGSWANVGASRWWNYPAGGAVNMASKNLNSVGAMTVNGLSSFYSLITAAGGLTAYGIVRFQTPATFWDYLNAQDYVRFYKTGGSYASPIVNVAGVSRFNEKVYHDGLLSLYDGLFITPNTTIVAPYSIGFYSGNSGHGCVEGNVFCGHSTWISTLPAATFASHGNIIAEHGFYTAGVKAFIIDHPADPSKSLYHLSVESPLPELIYRGKTTLVAGGANVNLNTYYGLIPTTLDSMITNLSVNVYNNASWTRVRCSSVSGVDFSIIAETNTCVDEVEWIAIGRRCDAGVTNYMIEVDK